MRCRGASHQLAVVEASAWPRRVGNNQLTQVGTRPGVAYQTCHPKAAVKHLDLVHLDRYYLHHGSVVVRTCNQACTRAHRTCLGPNRQRAEDSKAGHAPDLII